jgi:hypothetical protein
MSGPLGAVPLAPAALWGRSTTSAALSCHWTCLGSAAYATAGLGMGLPPSGARSALRSTTGRSVPVCASLPPLCARFVLRARRPAAQRPAPAAPAAPAATGRSVLGSLFAPGGPPLAAWRPASASTCRSRGDLPLCARFALHAWRSAAWRPALAAMTCSCVHLPLPRPSRPVARRSCGRPPSRARYAFRARRPPLRARSAREGRSAGAANRSGPSVRSVCRVPPSRLPANRLPR